MLFLTQAWVLLKWKSTQLDIFILWWFYLTEVHDHSKFLLSCQIKVKIMQGTSTFYQTWTWVNFYLSNTQAWVRNSTPPLMFHFGNAEIENVKEFTYLDFQISSNGNMKATITDRHSKASKMANVILRAINTNNNINVRLAMSLFDKQIVPILLYGSAIWSIPKEHNLLYLEQIPENENTRKIVSETLEKICGKSIDLRYARRVGKRDPNTPRRILINVKHISDKMELLRNSCKYRCVVSNFGNENVFNSELETCQTNYIKRLWMCLNTPVHCQYKWNWADTL